MIFYRAALQIHVLHYARYSIDAIGYELAKPPHKECEEILAHGCIRIMLLFPT